MRLRIAFRVLNKGAKFPLSYKYELSSWLYKVLNDGNPELTAWLHSRGYTDGNKKFKFFTFSDLKIPEYELCPPYMRVKASRISFIISIYVDKIAETLIVAAFNNKPFELGDKHHRLRLQMEQLKTLPVDISRETLTLRTNSPLIISRQPDPIKGETQAQYLSPEDAEYEHYFCQNLINKYQVALKHGLISPLAASQNLNFKLLKAKVYKKGITIKANTPNETKLIGYQYKFELTAPKELIRLGMLSGFGEKNAMGFGSVEFSR